MANRLITEGVPCSLRGETFLKGVGNVTTYWVHAEHLVLDSSSIASSDGVADNPFSIPASQVIEMPRRRSSVAPVFELQEVIIEEEEPQEEEWVQDHRLASTQETGATVASPSHHFTGPSAALHIIDTDSFYEATEL